MYHFPSPVPKRIMSTTGVGSEIPNSGAILCTAHREKANMPDLHSTPRIGVLTWEHASDMSSSICRPHATGRTFSHCLKSYPLHRVWFPRFLVLFVCASNILVMIWERDPSSIFAFCWSPSVPSPSESRAPHIGCAPTPVQYLSTASYHDLKKKS
jgi:hypothetical protein